MSSPIRTSTVRLEAGGAPVCPIARAFRKRANACGPNSSYVVKLCVEWFIRHHVSPPLLETFLNDVKSSYEETVGKAICRAEIERSLQKQMERTPLDAFVYALRDKGIDLKNGDITVEFASNNDGERTPRTQGSKMHVVVHHADNHFWTTISGFPAEFTTRLIREFQEAARGVIKAPDEMLASHVRDRFRSEILADIEANAASKKQPVITKTEPLHVESDDADEEDFIMQQIAEILKAQQIDADAKYARTLAARG